MQIKKYLKNKRLNWKGQKIKMSLQKKSSKEYTKQKTLLKNAIKDTKWT